MTDMLLHPVNEPCAWKATDFAGDDSWMHRLTAQDLGEIDDALAAVRRRGLRHFQFGKADFPLPTLGARIAEILRELEFGRGFAMLRGLPVDDYDVDSLYTIYWGLGAHLGTPMSQNAKGELIAEVTDRGKDYEQNNVRGYTTRAALVPHCDSTDVVTLLCVHPSKSGGASWITSSIALYNDILENHPEYLEPLYAGYHYDLRGEGATGAPDEVTRNAVPVFSWHEGRLSCRFNSKMIERGAIKSGRPLASLAQEAIRYMAETALKKPFRFDMEFQKGDIQLLNNYCILHSRETYEDWPEPERRRRLLRLWLNVPNGRALAPDFADRYNTGPRGGVAVTQSAA